MLKSLGYRLRRNQIAATLDDKQYYDADWLLERQLISMRASGRSITELDLDITNLTQRKIKVLLPAGVYFPARGNHQNMVNTREVAFRLKPGGTRFLNVSVACMNAARPIPNNTHGFSGLSRADEALIRFISLSRDAPAMVVQAGVWALTDGLSRSEMKRQLINEGAAATRGQAITDADIDQANALLKRADSGIQIH